MDWIPYLNAGRLVVAWAHDPTTLWIKHKNGRVLAFSKSEPLIGKMLTIARSHVGLQTFMKKHDEELKTLGKKVTAKK